MLTAVFAPRYPDSVFRVGGDEFCVLLNGEAAVAEMLEQLEAELSQSAQQLGFPLSAAAGTAWVRPNELIESAMMRADAKMYQNKRGIRVLSENENEKTCS